MCQRIHDRVVHLLQKLPPCIDPGWVGAKEKGVIEIPDQMTEFAPISSRRGCTNQHVPLAAITMQEGIECSKHYGKEGDTLTAAKLLQCSTRLRSNGKHHRITLRHELRGMGVIQGQFQSRHFACQIRLPKVSIQGTGVCCQPFALPGCIVRIL